MAQKYDPFKANVEPLDPSEGMALLPLALRRSIMWDMVGASMIHNAQDFGENPASSDVLEMEFNDMVRRHRALELFGPNIDMACNIATNAAIHALSVLDPSVAELSEEEREEMAEVHTKVSTMVTKSVIGQMMSRGMIHPGAHV